MTDHNGGTEGQQEIMGHDKGLSVSNLDKQKTANFLLSFPVI